MNLYKSYCYPDLQSAINSLQSQVYIDGIGLIQSITPVPPDAALVSYVHTDSSGYYLDAGTVTVTFPECTQQGFDNSYFGLSIPDAIDLGWEVFLILTVAASIKIIKKVT